MGNLDFENGDLAGEAVAASLGVDVVGLPCVVCDVTITDDHDDCGLVPVGGQRSWSPICSEVCVAAYFANGGDE